MVIDSKSSLLLLPFLAAAVWYDWREKRIPNRVIESGLAVGLAAAAAEGFAAAGAGAGSSGAAWALLLGLLRILATVLLTGGLYVLRMVGAGDIKLMAMIMGCLGLWRGGLGILMGLCLGAVWSLFKLVSSGTLVPRLLYFVDYIRQYARTGRAVPYYRKGEDGEEIVIPLGACIAAGSSAVLVIDLIKKLAINS